MELDLMFVFHLNRNMSMSSNTLSKQVGFCQIEHPYTWIQFNLKESKAFYKGAFLAATL
jgi:hypothetical protein